MKVSISKSVLQKFPNIVEGIVVAHGVNVETSHSRSINELLRKSEKDLISKYKGKGIEDVASIKVWDEIYKSVGEDSEMSKKDKQKMLPSHKNLALRVLGGDKIPNVNPLVNYYNALSLKYLLPFGAEDLSGYFGDLQLDVADGSELFLEINGKKVGRASKGEIVWKDSHSVSCRMWAWRQSERTKITRTTVDLIVIIDYVDDGGEINMLGQQSVDEVANGLESLFGGKVERYILDQRCPVVEFPFKSRSMSELTSTVEQNLASLVVSKVQGTKGIRKRKPESLRFEATDSLLRDLDLALRPYLPKDIGDIGLAYSQDGFLGDVSSSVAFRYSKILKDSPRNTAEMIVKNMVDQREKEDFEKAPFSIVTAAENGFINIRISPEFISKKLETVLENLDIFGRSNVGGGKLMLVESPCWNPNKTPHVGHLLNILLGKALIRLFQHVGLEAENDDIINDKGLPVMQTLWAYQKFADGATPESTGDKPDHFVYRYYVLGKNKYNEDPEVQKAVRDFLVRWEKGDKEIRMLWERLVNWSYTGQRQTIKRIWEEPGYAWYESDVYKGGKEIITEHLGEGVLEKLDDGAVIARIEQEYGLPDTIVLKSDGTGLYHTQDMGLLVRKKEKFDPWKIIYVVGEEQVAHFQRLFAILDALNIMPMDDLYHFAYSVVVGKDGKKLSSRDGLDLSADDLMDQMKDEAATVLRSRSSDIPDKVLDEISDAVAIGALKYSLLSRDPFKQMKFDVEESLSFTGKSGPYIMYAYTRAKNIQKKVGQVGEERVVTPDVFEKVYTDDVRNLVIRLLKYPEVIIQSSNNYSPGILAEYLFDLAKSFNNFYESVRVVDATPEDQRILLDVVKLSMHVLKDGLQILGIKTLDEM